MIAVLRPLDRFTYVHMTRACLFVPPNVKYRSETTEGDKRDQDMAANDESSGSAAIQGYLGGEEDVKHFWRAVKLDEELGEKNRHDSLSVESLQPVRKTLRIDKRFSKSSFQEEL